MSGRSYHGCGRGAAGTGVREHGDAAGVLAAAGTCRTSGSGTALIRERLQRIRCTADLQKLLGMNVIPTGMTFDEELDTLGSSTWDEHDFFFSTLQAGGCGRGGRRL